MLAREKKKWQINLRRYVIEKSPCPAYAPYFGLDIQTIRAWFECQFPPGVGWGDFGALWQFDHIIPVAHFDFADTTDLKLCWNFLNLRIRTQTLAKTEGTTDLMGAGAYFDELFEKTGHPMALQLSYKVRKLEQARKLAAESQLQFLTEKASLLKEINSLTEEEFQLLNQGKTPEEAKKEIALFYKNLRR